MIAKRRVGSSQVTGNSSFLEVITGVRYSVIPHLYLSFFLPRRSSGPGLRKQAFLPPPNYGTRLHFCREETTAFTSLVGTYLVVLQVSAAAAAVATLEVYRGIK